MKRSKRLLSLFLAVMVLLTTVVSATMVSASAAGIENSALCSEYYATNPNNQVGKQTTIAIDGSFSDWDSSMLIAKGAAWDVANHYKGAHENCLLDTIGLYAAWDNENLYVAWQMVNTTDTWHREGDGSLSDGGRVLDVPLILALSVDPSSPSMTNKIAGGNNIWDMKAGVEFTTHVDHLFYMSGKPGLGKPSMFTAVDAQGNTDYTSGCKEFSTIGVSYKMAEGNISDEIWGLNFSEDPADITSAESDWVDYKTFKGQMGTHNTKYDSFYEIKIPFTALGIDANYLTTNGIGAMLVATRGESGLDCIPFDTTMLDNALGEYGSDASTSHEKDDVDNITVEFARIGKSGGAIAPPTKPVATEPTTVAPVVTTPTAITTEPSEVTTTAVTPTEGSDPIVVPPVVTTTPEENPTIQVPTLDFGDDTTVPTESTDGATPTNPDVTPAEGILGDADGNKTVNIKDATLIQKHLARITTLSDDAQFLGDVDANEVLNIRDVTAIQKWLAKIPVGYAIGEPVSDNEIIIPVPTTKGEESTTEAPIVVPVVTTAPTENPTTAAPAETTASVEPTQATTATPVYTEPVYTDPIYTEPNYPDYPAGGTITVYFENTYGWSNVYWHAWNDAGATSTPWPGDAMTQVSGNVYSATISSEYTGIIFNDGAGGKTDNATIAGDGQIFSNGSWTTYDPNGNYGGGGNNDPYYPPSGSGRTVYFSNVNKWDAVYIYCWNDGGGKNAEWPGVTMTLVEEDNGYGQQVYSYNVPAEYNYIIFSNGNGTQCADINLNNEANNGFFLTGEVVNEKGHYGYATYPR